MKDIKDFILDKKNECEKRSKNWTEKSKAIDEYIKLVEIEQDIYRLNINRFSCDAKSNELLAIADFCDSILKEYF